MPALGFGLPLRFSPKPSASPSLYAVQQLATSGPKLTATAGPRKLAKPNCLFGIVERDLNPVSEKIFNRINQFMRSADTPDSGKEHSHQLRHGFGTCMFLALLFADQERMPVLFPQLKETNEWLSKCAKLKTGLFRHAYSTRKCAFLLARLLGHSSPGTTLENYVHVADYLVSAGFKLAVLGGSRRHQFNPGPTLEQPKLRIDGAAQSNKIGAGSNGFQKNAEQLG